MIVRDKMFPALGFGAKLPNGTVSHEFYLVSFCSFLMCFRCLEKLSFYVCCVQYKLQWYFIITGYVTCSRHLLFYYCDNGLLCS